MKCHKCSDVYQSKKHVKGHLLLLWSEQCTQPNAVAQHSVSVLLYSCLCGILRQVICRQCLSYAGSFDLNHTWFTSKMKNIIEIFVTDDKTKSLWIRSSLAKLLTKIYQPPRKIYCPRQLLWLIPYTSINKQREKKYFSVLPWVSKILQTGSMHSKFCKPMTTLNPVCFCLHVN